MINQISQFGMGNKEEMARLWAECDCDFDRSEFDKGMIYTLLRFNVPDPQDPF